VQGEGEEGRRRKRREVAGGTRGDLTEEFRAIYRQTFNHFGTRIYNDDFLNI
jgi:hypothetical protein